MPDARKGFMRRLKPHGMPFPAPILAGGQPALDFLNTIATPQSETIEYLGSGAALLNWLAVSGCIGPAEARSVDGKLPRAALDAVARDAVALREWFRPIVQRSAGSPGPTLSQTERQRLNAVLSSASHYQQINPSRRGFAMLRARRWSEPHDVLAPIAEAMAELLCTADFRLIRKCGNPACTLWFLDRTKAHRRRWCSMEVCGNRAKVAAHRGRRARSRRARNSRGAAPFRRPRLRSDSTPTARLGGLRDRDRGRDRRSRPSFFS